MDHLQLDSRYIPASCQDVAFHGAPSTAEFRDFTFFDYPIKSGWVLSTTSFYRSETARRTKPEISSQEGHAFTIFLQKWLFFFLLREFFRSNVDFCAEDFRSSPPNRRLITTRLKSYLQQWERTVSDNGQQELVRLQRLLQAARYWTSHCLSVIPSRLQEEAREPTWAVQSVQDDFHRLSLIVMALGQTLTNALYQIQLQKYRGLYFGWSDQVLYEQGWGYSKIVYDELKQTWPGKQFSRLAKVLKKNSIGFLLARGTLPHRNAELETPRHICNNSKECESICPYSSDSVRWTRKLEAIIDDNKIPMLVYRDGGRLDFEAFEEETIFREDYVAFSHVWRDGLGNEDQNSLPRCVLEKFASLRDEHNFPDYFWMDVLSIPLGEGSSRQRNKATATIPHIYRHAKCTLVLDSEMYLRLGPLGKDAPPSIAMGVTTCSWMERIWTLQESFLSHELYLVFEGTRACSLTEFEQMLYQRDYSPSFVVSRAAQSYSERILRSDVDRLRRLDTSFTGSLANPEFVGRVWNSCQFREARFFQDEAKALATLLGLDLEAVVRKELQDERMCALLEQLAKCKPCGVPPGIIFLKGPSIRIQAFQWAPQTWLGGEEVLTPNPMTNVSGTSCLTRTGLEVAFPGFLLNDLPLPKDLATNPFMTKNRLCFPVGCTLEEWYEISVVERKSELRLRAQSQVSQLDTHFPEETCSSSLAVIAFRLPVEQPEEIALLVRRKLPTNSLLYVDVQNRVWLRKMSQKEALEQKERIESGRALQFSLAEQLPPQQRWCIEGRHAEAG